MYKIITFILAVCLSITSANAASITKTLRGLNINHSAVSISVKDLKDGSVVYSLNQNTPMPPASTLKLITLMASTDILKPDYKFSTVLYKSKNNDLYIKLGADPFFTSGDLEFLMSTAIDKKIKEPKAVYIDDSIFDNIEWGEGWQWDDELSPYMPKFSAYNIDSNMLNIIIAPNNSYTYCLTSIRPYYPLNVMNLLTTDPTSANKINIEKNEIFAPNTISATGVVSKKQIINIPTPNPRIYYKLRLEEAVRKVKIDYSGIYKVKTLPSNDIYKVEEVKHDFSQAISEILKNSNNMTAETVFKLAGAKYTSSKGTNENSINMLNDYLKKLGLDTQNIKIVDGSGVSKNNIMTANFMTDFLVKIQKDANYDILKDNLPTPGQGTLKNRMLYFRDNLKAKTGTLADTSAIAGYIVTRKGNIYAFDIMINDAKTTEADKKNIEEQILRYIYMN